jgi:hypothetical protein
MAIITVITFSALGGKARAGFQYESTTGLVLSIGGTNGSTKDFDIELPPAFAGASSVAERRSEKVTPGQTRWGAIASERVLVSFDEDGLASLPIASEFRAGA